MARNQAQAQSDTQPDAPAEKETTYINVPLPVDLHRQLRVKAFQNGTNLTEAVIEAVEHWVAND